MCSHKNVKNYQVLYIYYVTMVTFYLSLARPVDYTRETREIICAPQDSEDSQGKRRYRRSSCELRLS